MKKFLQSGKEGTMASKCHSKFYFFKRGPQDFPRVSPTYTWFSAAATGQVKAKKYHLAAAENQVYSQADRGLF